MSPHDSARISQSPLEHARILVLVSGEGSNMRALAEAAADPAWGGSLVGVLADRDCAGIDWADTHGITTRILRVRDFPERSDWDAALADGEKS